MIHRSLSKTDEDEMFPSAEENKEEFPIVQGEGGEKVLRPPMEQQLDDDWVPRRMRKSSSVGSSSAAGTSAGDKSSLIRRLKRSEGSGSSGGSSMMKAIPLNRALEEAPPCDSKSHRRHLRLNHRSNDEDDGHAQQEEAEIFEGKKMSESHHHHHEGGSNASGADGAVDMLSSATSAAASLAGNFAGFIYRHASQLGNVTGSPKKTAKQHHRSSSTSDVSVVDSCSSPPRTQMKKSGSRVSFSDLVQEEDLEKGGNRGSSSSSNAVKKFGGDPTTAASGKVVKGTFGAMAVPPPPNFRRSQSSTFSIQEELHFNLDPDFDTSATHLMKLFAMIDKDGNGILTYDELYDAVLSMPGLQSIPREKLDLLFEKMDEDGTQGVSQDEFIEVFQHIATKALARKGTGNLIEFMVYDYGPDQALCRRIYQKDPNSDELDKTVVEYSLDEYFEEPIEDVKPGNVRWIAITGLEPSVVVQLANRYRLHPLQIEDVLNYHKQRMKSDKSNRVLQLLVGRCVHSDIRGLPTIIKEQVTIFYLEDYSTVITIQQSPSEINKKLLARILYAGSKIRLNGPRFLTYAVVDAIVDELFPILRQIRKKLKALHSDVTATNKKTSLKTIHLIQHIIREVNLLLLWLSPLGTVVSRLGAELLDDNNDYDLRKHIEDLVDHVAALKEQTSSMIGWAKSLNDEYLNEQQYRMNEVIYILTMTTSLMLPAQFLTGVFGMNFEVFPLLNDPWGFPIFWFLCGSAMIGILVIFRMKGWL